MTEKRKIHSLIPSYRSLQIFFLSKAYINHSVHQKVRVCAILSPSTNFIFSMSIKFSFQHSYFRYYTFQVHLVGINQVLVVTHPHCGRWLMSSEDGGDCLVPYRPWSSISTPDPNSTLLGKYRQGVLAYIMVHPGVTLVCVRPSVYMVGYLVGILILVIRMSIFIAPTCKSLLWCITSEWPERNITSKPQF